ncbi:hypothetical protein [Streptomyces sp. NPDC053728]|uniref:hypothetical protein n=1 Tax=unclassified Streptomyces TaxID=2593676 RepID=UPI00343B44B7
MEPDDQRLGALRAQAPAESHLVVMGVRLPDVGELDPGNWAWTPSMTAVIPS